MSTTYAHLPALQPEPIPVSEAADHTAEISRLKAGLKKLAWRKQEGDENLARRIEERLAWLKQQCSD